MIKETTKTKNDLSLKKFLTLAPGSSEYITLKNELKLKLTDPGSLERSDLTSEDLREEARTISDAFEAITNGMHNPEVFSAMAAISDNSLLAFWKELIYAIKAFYGKNYTEMEFRLNNIEAGSLLTLFKPILMHLSGKSQLKALNNKQKAFIDNIIRDRSFIRSVIEQIVESLEYDMEDLFLETTDLLLRDLNRNYKETAGRFAIWSIETASRYKYSPADLVATCRKLFGNTEAYRLTAIALSNEEPDISLLFWIQSLISRLKSMDPTIYETAAYLTVISRLAGTIKSSSDNFYLESLKGLVTSMKSELDQKFPDISGKSEKLMNPFEDLIRQSAEYSSLDENRIRFVALDTSSGSRDAKSCVSTAGISKTSSDKPIQLSLFD